MDLLGQGLRYEEDDEHVFEDSPVDSVSSRSTTPPDSPINGLVRHPNNDQISKIEQQISIDEISQLTAGMYKLYQTNKPTVAEQLQMKNPTIPKLNEGYLTPPQSPFVQPKYSNLPSTFQNDDSIKLAEQLPSNKRTNPSDSIFNDWSINVPSTGVLTANSQSSSKNQSSLQRYMSTQRIMSDNTIQGSAGDFSTEKEIESFEPKRHISVTAHVETEGNHLYSYISKAMDSSNSTTWPNLGISDVSQQHSFNQDLGRNSPLPNDLRAPGAPLHGLSPLAKSRGPSSFSPMSANQQHSAMQLIFPQQQNHITVRGAQQTMPAFSSSSGIPQQHFYPQQYRTHQPQPMPSYNPMDPSYNSIVDAAVSAVLLRQQQQQLAQQQQNIGGLPSMSFLNPAQSQLVNNNNNRPLRSEKIDIEIIKALIRQAKMKRRLGLKKEVCVFCRNNGENELIYTSHSLKDSNGNVSCPILRAYQCPICGSTGSAAHTIKYCQAASEDSKRLCTPYEKLLRQQLLQSLDGMNMYGFCL
ncbi:unnamed protein product [Didymodactylos carnosus]|uniref:Nanos-type domain-containing protein n=1 Tax=Didymodactylos carnosus TaxID=1234261 RepID=A0A814L3V1_9BILA|nr:unnamed protein product [Didymodactylos carnosus]CAF1059634.1 unnamed protein product [Didymodactylos carnosus]CAF3708547.1 unnamed protein product [Didymodactylos carnosus]CAF3828130.1 unnamed protein product [Didymodactylos carnosus]